jgi:diguanylate cyclase (GGDEF)-like protein
MTSWRPESLDALSSQEPEPGFVDDNGDQIVRICRIAARLFNVAECVVTFNRENPQQLTSARAHDSMVQAFCRSLSHADELTVVPNASLDKTLCRHSMVADAPHIRFYACCPVRNDEGDIVGNISLIDYLPRVFTHEDGENLGDLAHLVERDIHAKSMRAAQLELRRKNRRLRRKSLIDSMLGTWNRSAIKRILTIEAARCKKAEIPLSLIVMDLDFFKKVNDAHGHAVGDAALVKVASSLRSCIREQEALGRYGGEEFLVVLPGSSLEAAMAVAERMRRMVASKPERIGNLMLNFTVSAGVASTDLFPSATVEEMINHADIALYAAKDAGRNCVKPAEPEPN